MSAISVIVPTLNEVDNIGMLVSRIAAGFSNTDIDYEILFVDDHSTDGTVTAIQNLAGNYPVRVLLKQGERGKAHSLLEGFAAAQYDTLCMIDADLQYPPEAITPMFNLMNTTKTDIVLTNRQDHATPLIRKITSTGFNFVFTKLLFGFDYDSQSGLKLFKRKVIDSVTLTPTPWSFDLEFIVRSLEQNFKIVSYDITFAERYSGVAKIQVSKVAVELAKASVKLRFSSSPKKVKENYKTNNRNLQRILTAGIVAFGAGIIFTLTYTSPALALSVLDPNLATAPTLSIVADTTPLTTPISNQPAPATSPETAYTTATPPTAPTSTVSVPTYTTAPQNAAPKSTTTAKNYSSSNVTSTARPTATAQPNITTGQPAPITSSVLAANNIRYPALSKSTKAAFNYPDHKPSKSAAYIRPLSYIALAIITIGATGYTVAGLVTKFKASNYQPTQVAGTTES